MNGNREHLVEGRVVRIRVEGEHRYGQVDVRGARVEVLLDLLPGVDVGQRVLFHGRVALAVLGKEGVRPHGHEAGGEG